MADPLHRPLIRENEQLSPDGCTLYSNTLALAGAVAAKSIGKRQAKILQMLKDHGPMAIFEIAALLHVFEHQISGRFSELERDGHIEKAGMRRRKGETGCWAEVYQLRSSAAEASDK